MTSPAVAGSAADGGAPPGGLVVEALTKSYGPNTVLKGVDLVVRRGEVHAFLGPNGSGKSTLLSCLSGATRPDSGVIRLDGRSYAGFTPASSIAAGTAMIYQHFQIIEDLSIVDNIFLGSELRTRSGAVDRREQHRRAVELLGALHIDLPPETVVASLSTGQRQIVEIARALRHEPSLLILDEPTAALSASEVATLLALVRRLARERGIAVIYVTHLLREVLDVADTVTVLLDGSVLWTRPIAEVVLEDLIRAMTVAPTGRQTASVEPAPDAPIVCAFEGYRSEFTGPLDLDIREGEIIGVYGLLGSGRTDLLESIAGVQRRPIAGEFRLHGRRVHERGPGRRSQSGIALVASDRRAQSLFGELSAQENVLMPHYRRLSRPLRRGRREREVFEQVAGKVQLRPMAPRLDADRFSGGNAQKLAVGRWLAAPARLSMLLLDEPTQGVDRGAREEIYGLLREFVGGSGRCVVFTTSDPEEALALATRILVLAHGRPVALLPRSADEATLLRHAHTGERSNAAAADPSTTISEEER